MNAIPSRRRFLRTTAATGALAGAGDYGFLGGLPPVSAAESTVDPDAVRFRPEIEPLVRLLEETPHQRLLEEVADRIRNGTTYREVLTALLLAGVRNIQPRPVGFKFHAVLVVNSAHLASRHSPESERWLPIFWALNQFKVSQARDVAQGDWTMAPVDETAVPDAAKARRAFVEAMDAWDVERTDAAVAGLTRTAGAQELFDLLCRYGARDFRDIGHKAIYVSNGWRALQTIGWRHAEPVMRSLAYALLEHDRGNPAENDYLADLPGRKNQERLKEIRAGWTGGEVRTEATDEMLGALRHAGWDESGTKVVELLNRGVAPRSLWDALFQHAAEMLMRRPGILSLHSCTTTNAMHYAWLHTHDDETRRFLLLQNASFLTLFRDRGDTSEGVEIDAFEPAEGTPSLDDIFAEIGRDRLSAARQSLAWLRSEGGAGPFLDAARRFIYLKGTNSHDYKFSSAVLEDYHHLSPSVRDRFLAGSVFWLKGSGAPDSPLVARTRAALSG
ncbi:MAG: twin-arginine translocation signal domain-containing protein [Verrucomicrobiales bacterium]